jgi:hypothetical protein
MDPDTIIQFSIGDRTITRDFKRTVREIIQLPTIRKYYCERFRWSDNIFDIIDWEVFRPVYKKYIATKGVQWMHKYCIKKLPTGERVHTRDHFHDKRCASCWHALEDDDHILQCSKRRSTRKKVINQVTLLRNRIDPRMCDILQEGLLTYFNGEPVANAMIRIRGQEGYERYDLLIDEQTTIGWDNLLRGKFSKQWKIQQRAYVTRRKLHNPFEYAKAQRRKRRETAKKDKKDKTRRKKNKTEDFHAFFQAIVPIIQEMWTDRCIDRNKPVIGGRIVAEYDSLTKKITQLYTMKEMVLPEDEMKIFNETLETRLQDTNQQLKKWLMRWKPVIDHSMKRVKELAKKNCKPIWKHFTAKEPAKTRVSRRITTRKHNRKRRMTNNPLTNVYIRLNKKRSSSRVIKATTRKYKRTDLISHMYKKLGKSRSTSRNKVTMDVEEQVIDDRFGDVPA